MTTLDVSMIITNFNRGKFLDRAVRSCLDQIVFRRSFEVIIVDDASTDNSTQIIKTYEQDVVSVLLETNRGVGGASNAGINASKGKYIMRVDADDFLNKLAITYTSQILDENPAIDFVYCDHYRVDEVGFKQSRVPLSTQQKLFEHGAGVLFRTSALKEVGGYDETLRTCEDYDLIGRLIQNGCRGFHLPIALYRYHIHGLNLTLQDDRNDAIIEMEKKYVSLHDR